MSTLGTTVINQPTSSGAFGNMPLPVTLFPTLQSMPAMRLMQVEALPPVRINAMEILQKECASDREGERIYHLLKAALSEGRRVILSVKDLDLDALFFDESVCRLYGDFPEETVDNGVEIVDMTKVDTYDLRDAKAFRKLYYYDRAEFDKRAIRRKERMLMEGDPVCDIEDFDPDYVPGPSDDPYALGNFGKWINQETGEEYFI